MRIGTFADLRTSRSIKRAVVICAIVFGLAVVYRVVWEVTVGMPQSRRYDQTVQLAEDAQRSIRLDPRFSAVRVFVTLRINGFTGKSFNLHVSGVVLNDAEEAELRSRFEALKPPQPFGWQVLNCFGDEQAFKSLRGDDETDTPP
jgi:hypothetical protein